MIAHRVNTEFVPVALKAAMINNPPPGLEGRLYAEISRSKPAPQGICVANSACKVLAWVLSFDNDAAIEKFLDHALRRTAESPNADRPVTAERYMRFPGHQLTDIEDTGTALEVPSSHAQGDRCPAIPQVEPGTLVGRIVGRPLDEHGRPIKKTARQEDYMEARFEISAGLQRQFIKKLSAAPAEASFAVPPEMARQIVSPAFLGQLDVNPLGGHAIGGKTDQETIAFQARRFHADSAAPESARRDDGQQIVQIIGSSKVAGSPSAIGTATDGRQWEHRVELTWEGYVTIEGDQFVELTMLAEGTETLRWGSERWNLSQEPTVAHLMAGHPIDLNSPVRYGLLAASAEPHEIVASVDPLHAGPQNGDGNHADSPAQDDLNEAAIRKQIQRLRAAGKTEQADQMQRSLQQRIGRGNAGPLAQRLAHLREAIKHLQAAGANDIAAHVAKQVQRMEQNEK